MERKKGASGGRGMGRRKRKSKSKSKVRRSSARTTCRSAEYLRKSGYMVEVVERYNRFSLRTNDLFGFADVLAVKDGEGIVAVQATDAAHAARTRKKMESSEPLRCWLRSGGKFRVHVWKRCETTGKWVVTEDVYE